MKESGLGQWLCVPDHKCDEIQQKHPTIATQMRATVEYWLSVDPTPSWRRLLRALDGCGEHQTAENITPYVEALTGEYCTLYASMITQ